MVIYLNDAMQQLVARKGNSRETISSSDLRESVIAGAAKRLHPSYDGISILFALLPILWSSGSAAT
jgi:Cu(I)/Ag(I) efflux system membrane protein CusA/SilA